MKRAEQPRIIIFVGSLSLGGGAEKAACSLGNALTAEGYDVLLVTFYEWKKEYSFSGKRICINEEINPNTVKKILHVARRIWIIGRLYKQNSMNICICFEETNYYAILAKKIFFSGARIISVIQVDPRQLTSISQLLIRLLYRESHKIVCVSDALKSVLESNFKLSNIVRIYNPIDDDIITRSNHPLPHEWEWLNDHSPLLISIGRHVFQKGQWHLIRAMTKVVKQFSSAHLIIAGEGELHESLQRLISCCSLERQVSLIGTHSNIYPLIHKANIFVFSSIYEGLANVLSEAMFLGKPVVTSDFSPTPREIIAPDISPNVQITYPLKTRFGILSCPVEVGLIFKSTEEMPLTPGENMLANSIITALSSKWEKLEHADKSHLDEFKAESVLRAWKNIISNDECLH